MKSKVLTKMTIMTIIAAFMIAALSLPALAEDFKKIELGTRGTVVTVDGEQDKKSPDNKCLDT